MPVQPLELKIGHRREDLNVEDRLVLVPEPLRWDLLLELRNAQLDGQPHVEMSRSQGAGAHAHLDVALAPFRPRFPPLHRVRLGVADPEALEVIGQLRVHYLAPSGLEGDIRVGRPRRRALELWEWANGRPGLPAAVRLIGLLWHVVVVRPVARHVDLVCPLDLGDHLLALEFCQCAWPPRPPLAAEEGEVPVDDLGLLGVREPGCRGFLKKRHKIRIAAYLEIWTIFSIN